MHAVFATKLKTFINFYLELLDRAESLSRSGVPSIFARE